MSRPGGGDEPGRPTHPPRLLRVLLRILLPARERDHLQAEMAELYGRRSARHGRLRARLWYLRHAAGFGLRFAPRRLAALADGSAGATLRDARLAGRVLLRRPGYALTTLLTLGIGIGGATVVFAAANWALLRPVPGVSRPDGLLTLRLQQGESSPAFPVSQPDLETFEERLAPITDLVASTEYEVNLDPGAGGPPRRVAAALVTPDWFRVLGISPYRGRLLDPGSGGPEGEEDVAVVSHRLWRDITGGDEALGATLRINGHPYAVVGVAPPGFHGAELPGHTDLWLPPAALPHVEPGRPLESLEQRGSTLWRQLVARAAPGANPTVISAEGARVMEEVRQEYRRHSFHANYTLHAYPGVGLAPRARNTARRTLTVLGLGALLLLFLACANATNLSLAHASARRAAVSVHRALGAGRSRVARLVLMEHLILGLGGGALGVALTAWSLRTFSDASLSRFGASLQGIELDVRVLGFVAVVALGVALLTGLPPALAAGRGGILPGLRGQAHGSRSAARTRGGLVVVQVALATVLLVGAGLLARTVVNLGSVELGYEPGSALRFSIDPRSQGYGEEEVRTLLVRLEERLREEPGVRAAGFVSPAPITGSYVTDHALPPGGDDWEDMVRGAGYQVTSGALEALGVTLVEGRWLDASETPRPGGPPALVVISEAGARQVFPEIPAAATPGRLLRRLRGEPARIVGVVRDIRPRGPYEAPVPVFFRPWGDGPAWADIAAVVRTTGDPAALGGRVRAIVASVAPDLPVYGLRPMREQVDRIIVEQRLAARIAAVLAMAGVLLTGVGLAGVLGYAVTSRRREIAVRTALGARPAAVVGRFVGYGAGLAMAGLVVGLAAAAVLTRPLESTSLGPHAVLFGIEPLDATTYLAGGLVMLAVGAAAAWIPARRAARVAPMEVLAEP